jgi:hypothetical protein
MIQYLALVGTAPIFIRIHVVLQLEKPEKYNQFILSPI